LEAWPGGTAITSPRQNLRHVASADSFNREEFWPSLLPSEPMALDQAQVITTRWEAIAPAAEGDRGNRQEIGR
jgi:hypothetical protein